MNGAVYIAIGQNARNEARASIAGLRQKMPQLPIFTIGDKPVFPGVLWQEAYQPDQGGRSLKTNLLNVTPKQWRNIAYIDADTRIRGDLQVGFDALDDGWELVITASTLQDSYFMAHIDWEERLLTKDECGFTPLQLQGGVLFARRCARVQAFFEAWHSEWLRLKDQDQGALLRALQQVPLKVWLLGRPFNGGAVVEHRFGQARA